MVIGHKLVLFYDVWLSFNNLVYVFYVYALIYVKRFSLYERFF